MPKTSHMNVVATTNQDDILDQDELNQILIKIRQHCFTHRGVDPEQLFNRWDRDKDGTLDYDEMRLLMYKVLSTSEQEFEQLFTYIDKDGDDLISKQEFCEFVNTKPTKGAVLKEKDTLGSNNPERQSETFFGQLKPSVRKTSVISQRWKSDDVLDENELLLVHRKIRAASYTHRGTDIPALFAEWDIDNDGTLTRDEFYIAIKKLVSGITRPEFEQLCAKIDTENTGGIDVVMIQNFIEKYNKDWKRRRVKRGENEDEPVNDAVANSKFFGGLRPANNQHNDYSLKKHGRKSITLAEMKRLRKKVCAESYTAGGMDLRRVYDRLIPQDNRVDMRATVKFLRLALPTLKCMDEVKYVLAKWGLNKQNDGSLRYNDFVKWAKKKEPKKLKYRTTNIQAKSRHLGKEGIPQSSRFTGHTMGKRYIKDDEMFNDLIPVDLFKDLDKSHRKKTSEKDVKRAAEAAGIDMDNLESDHSEIEYSDDDDDDYQTGPQLSRREEKLRSVLDLGSWSDSDEDDSKGAVHAQSHSDDLNKFADFCNEQTTGSPDGSPKLWAKTQSIYGDKRQFGGGRFMLPQMPDMTGKSPFYGQDSDMKEREELAINYYWDKNQKAGLTGGPAKSSNNKVAEDTEKTEYVGRNINVRFVADPDEALKQQNFQDEPSHTYGLFGETAKFQSGDLEELIDPGTWNFSAGQAIKAINGKNNDDGTIFDAALAEDNPYRIHVKDEMEMNLANDDNEDDEGADNEDKEEDEPDSDFECNPYGQVEEMKTRSQKQQASQRKMHKKQNEQLPRFQQPRQQKLKQPRQLLQQKHRQQPQQKHNQQQQGQRRPQQHRNHQRRQGQQIRQAQHQQPHQQRPMQQRRYMKGQAQKQGNRQPVYQNQQFQQRRQSPRQSNFDRQYGQQHSQAQDFDQRKIRFGQQMNNAYTNGSPRKPTSMSPSQHRPRAGGRSMQQSFSNMTQNDSPHKQHPRHMYQGNTSLPQSPRSLRSERSTRSSNLGEPRTNRDRASSNAKWDPKLKKFVKA